MSQRKPETRHFEDHVAVTAAVTQPDQIAVHRINPPEQMCIRDRANDTWYPRLKCLAHIVATVIFLGFAAVVVIYFIKSVCPCCAGANI